MAKLTEQTDPVDSITVIGGGSLEIREALKVFRDGAEISKSYHRYALHPGDDLSGKDKRVIAIAKAVWTSEVVEAYRATVKESAV